MVNCCSKFWFFFCHSCIHVFGYIIPRLLRLLGGILICKPFRKNKQEADGYIWRPETQVRVIHHRTQLESCIDVFGLMDVADNALEDRQFCWPTDDPAERKRLDKEAQSKMLKYTSPLYSGHITTIMGCFRPSDTLEYARESMTAWDGCPVMLDWMYAEGEPPLCCGRNRYAHLTPENEIDYAPELAEDGTLIVPALPPGDADEEEETLAAEPMPTQHEPLDVEDELSTPSDARMHSRREDTTSVPVASDVTPARGLVVIFPGLSSYSGTNYVKSFVRALHRQGYHVCVLNVRGNGDTPLTTSFIFNGAYTRDTRDAMRQFFSKKALVRRFGRTMPVIGIGLSIGGAMLSKYVGEQGRAGADSHLDAAVTVCAPNDFLHMVEHMNRGTYQKNIYQDDMCSDIRNYILRHPALHKLPNVDNSWVAENIFRFKRVIHFDQHVLAKSNGYRSIHHYHIDTSAITWVPYTPVPLLVLSSFDDPVIGRSAMPHRWREIIQSNSRIVYVEPHPGGHLGFLGGPIDELIGRDNWMERFVLQRLETMIDYWAKVQHEPSRYCSGIMANCQHLEATPQEYKRRLAERQRRGKPRVVNFQDTPRVRSSSSGNNNNCDSGSDSMDSYDISDLKHNAPPRPDRLSNRCYFSHPTVAVVRAAPEERLLHNFFDARGTDGTTRHGHRGLPRQDTDRVAEYATAPYMMSPCQTAPPHEASAIAKSRTATTTVSALDPLRLAKPAPPLVHDSTAGYSSTSPTGVMQSSCSSRRLPPRRLSVPTTFGGGFSYTSATDAHQERGHGGAVGQLPLSSSSAEESHSSAHPAQCDSSSSSRTSALSETAVGYADVDDVRVDINTSTWHAHRPSAPHSAEAQAGAATPVMGYTAARRHSDIVDDPTYDAEVDTEDSDEGERGVFADASHQHRVNRFARETTTLFNEHYGFRSGIKPFNDYNLTSMEEERLPHHVPVVSNADYFVDPRAYMNKNL